MLRAVYQHSSRQIRYASIQSSAVPIEAPSYKIDLPKLNGHGPFADRPTFEVIGSPFSLLNARIPSKAVLYTRRGTILGVNGDLKNITSTLSIFNSGLAGAASRILGGIPFLYQKLQSNDAFTVLIGTQATATSFAVLELDGRYDWNITSKNALLAWTGVIASIKQGNIDRSLLRISTNLTGRGSSVIAGNGQVYQVTLEAGDEFMVHPSSVLAYADSCPRPLAVKLQSVRISVPFKLPSLSRFLLRYEFFQVMSKQTFWVNLRSAISAIRGFFRRLIWGDQMFVRFQGPTTILLQSRSRTSYQEDSQPREFTAVEDTQRPSTENEPKSYAGSLKIATVVDGRVDLADTKAFSP